MTEDNSKMRDLGRAAMQAQHASGQPTLVRPKRRGLGMENLADTIACLVAIFLCLVNALVWAFISGLPLVGILWVGAAALCLKLQAWARG
jgi:hypothetical protein